MRVREIYNILFWVYPYWWNKKTATFLLNKLYPKFGIDLFPPFLEIGPDFQFVSIYGGTKETSDNVCIGSDYNKVIENVKSFVKLKKQMKKRFPIISFHYIVTRDSKDEIFSFLDFVKSLDTEIGEVLVTPMLHDFKDAEEYAVTLDEDYIDKVREKADQVGIATTVNMIAYKEAEKLKEKPPFTCCKEYIMPFVFVTGDMSPCCSLNEANQRELLKSNSPGNLFNKSLRQIWYSKQYKNIRKMIRNNKCPKECAMCPAYLADNMEEVQKTSYGAVRCG